MGDSEEDDGWSPREITYHFKLAFTLKQTTSGERRKEQLDENDHLSSSRTEWKTPRSTHFNIFSSSKPHKFITFPQVNQWAVSGGRTFTWK